MIVVAVWTGREARALRTALRMPVLAFADYLGVGSRTVSDWERERARIVPTPVLQAALDTALSRAGGEAKARFHALAGGGAVVMSDSAASEGNGDDAKRREAVKALGIGGLGAALFPGAAVERIALHGDRAVDASLIAAHEDLADTLASLHRVTRPDVLLGQVAGHADTLYGRLDRPMGVADRRRLDVVAVESHVQAGMLAFQARDRTIARRYFALAVGVADDARDETLRALALAGSSLLHSSIPTGGVGGETERAVELLRRAAAHAQGADAKTRESVHRWLATELAASGDQSGFYGHMEQAERFSGPGRDRGYFARSLCNDGTARMWGVGLVLLGRAEQAVEALRGSLIPGFPSQAVLVLVDTAAARVLQGEPEEACQGLRRGLDVALDCGYAMGLERIRGVRARVAPHMAALPCVAELDERLASGAVLSLRG
ncbi:MAG: helix-turn-helix domain-containing protein [Egibacteraceae bacterium]